MNQYKVLLIGLGKMGFKYMQDKEISKTVKFSNHTQVINNHESFSLFGAVDSLEENLNLFSKTFNLKNITTDIRYLNNLDLVDVLVLATPPKDRYKFLEFLPNLKALIVEKPLGSNLKESKKLIDTCSARKIITQVNFNRRTDSVMQELAKGDLKRKIGFIQCGFGVYGHGILNYASHTIDLVRMLVGEITRVQSLSSPDYGRKGPISDDLNIPFVLYVDQKPFSFSPIDFSSYREGSLDIWGTKGRIEFLQEGLNYKFTEKFPCRSLSEFSELNSECTKIFETGYGDSMYNLYDEVAKKLKDSSKALSSPASSAFVNEEIIDSLKKSYANRGDIVKI